MLLTPTLAQPPARLRRTQQILQGGELARLLGRGRRRPAHVAEGLEDALGQVGARALGPGDAGVDALETLDDERGLGAEAGVQPRHGPFERGRLGRSAAAQRGGGESRPGREGQANHEGLHDVDRNDGV
jgi:hypothetical protein